jgi:hypothetical protein
MLRRRARRLALVLTLACAASAHAQSPAPSDFHARVKALYTFEPHKLSSKEIEAKSGELDVFWNYVKAAPEALLPELRRELADPSHTAFFYYDGSQLLLRLSKEPSDLALAAAAIPRADLRGVQHTDYLRSVQWLASRGVDTREAAFRVLAHPEFQAFIPQHALMLGQNYSLIYMLFPLDEAVFTSDLVARLAVETDAESQKSLLLALWYTVTPEGRTAIKDFGARANAAPQSAAYARELLGRKGGGPSLASEKNLRAQRREVMRRPISDEALHEFEDLTAKLLAKT